MECGVVTSMNMYALNVDESLLPKDFSAWPNPAHSFYTRYIGVQSFVADGLFCAQPNSKF